MYVFHGFSVFSKRKNVTFNIFELLHTFSITLHLISGFVDPYESDYTVSGVIKCVLLNTS